MRMCSVYIFKNILLGWELKDFWLINQNWMFKEKIGKKTGITIVIGGKTTTLKRSLAF